MRNRTFYAIHDSHGVQYFGDTEPTVSSGLNVTLHKFTSKKERDTWVDEMPFMNGNQIRASVSSKHWIVANRKEN